MIVLGGIKDRKAHRYDIGEGIGRLEMLADMETQFELPVRADTAGRIGESVRPSGLVRVLLSKVGGSVATS
jgi:hypothetical protein